nr:hypothetical protein K-LCC10_0420 [Kaumoebavirus]
MELPFEIIAEIGKCSLVTWLKFKECSKTLKKAMEECDPDTFKITRVCKHFDTTSVECRTGDGYLYKKLLVYTNAGVAEFTSRWNRCGLLQLYKDKWYEVSFNPNRLTITDICNDELFKEI